MRRYASTAAPCAGRVRQWLGAVQAATIDGPCLAASRYLVGVWKRLVWFHHRDQPRRCGRVAFTRRQPDGSWQIATIAPDGSDLQVLTTGNGVSEAPSWSPDGTWIAYDYAPTFPTDETWHTSLCRMNADGSEPSLLGDPDTFDVEPRISPGGSRVVHTCFTFDDKGAHSNLVVRDLAWGEETMITAAGDAVEHPNWSPDSEWIIYDQAPELGASLPRPQIERIAADGSGEPEVLVQGTVGGFKPWYSPDGDRILFGCIGASGDDAMCLADADGTNLVTLVDEPGVNENHFSWGAAAP